MTYNFQTQPYEHQLRDFERFKDDSAFCLFWEMGTGKTKETIDIAGYKFSTNQIDKVIIVAPNSVHEQWILEEVPKHCAVNYVTHVYRNKSTDKYMNELYKFLLSAQEPGVLPFLAIHYEAFQVPKIETTIKRYAANGARILWIYDEGTRAKNTESKTHKGLALYRRRYGGQCILLTGTALAKRPLDAYGMIELVRPGYMGISYTAFQRRHAVMMKQKVRYVREGIERETKVDAVLSEKLFWIVKNDLKKARNACNRVDLTWEDIHAISRERELSEADVKFIDESPVFTRFKNVEALKAQIAPMSSSLRKADCLQLPEKVYQEIQFDLNAEQKRVIHQMREYAVALYGDKELTIPQKQSLQIRALQVCGGFFPYVKEMTPDDKVKYALTPMTERNAKLEYIKDDLEELGDEPFIVWAVFTEELKMLCKELNKLVPTALVSGIVGMDEREEAVTGFKSGKYQGFVANPVVAGFGLNFQHCGYQYWYSRNYRTEARLQAEDRTHRIGIVRSPVYKDLVFRCGFERKVLADNKEGRDMNDYFNSATVADLFNI